MKVPMRRLFTLFIVLISVIPLYTQSSWWSSVPESAIELAPRSTVNWPLTYYGTFDFQLPALERQLRAAGRDPATIEFPTPDGRVLRLRLEPINALHPRLAARYPELRAYRATGPGVLAHVALSPLGMHATVRAPQGTYHIDPYANGQDRYHIGYYHSAIELPEEVAQLGCGLDTEALTEHHRPTAANRGGQGRSLETDPVDVRVYDMALATTGEYAQMKGGTLEDVMATLNASVVRLNLILEQELAMRVRLIPRNDELIFLDPDTDPYESGTNAASLLGSNGPAITSTLGVTQNEFDIGHVFTAGCSGGVAGLAGNSSACTGTRSRGVTCHFTNDLDVVVVTVFAHELGHQFSAGHTWNNCPSNASQRAPSTSFEPGSGSTIMSYAGVCGDQNVQRDADAYFHVGSLEEIIEYSRNGTGNTCATVLATSNRSPEITLPYQDGFYIPISTPFELRGSATDLDGDVLTYAWEEVDLGPPTDIGFPEGTAPLFRSIPPDTASNRIFPQLSNLLDNRSSNLEVLPTYSRPLNFRMTVRDNHPGGGAAVWESVQFFATAEAGPFRIQSPNSANEVWRGGESRSIQWDVANTNAAPVNCRAVDILLSLDGGLTYPIALLRGVPNAGSAVVNVPNVTSNTSRIRVQAADNIFFDISNEDFSILEAAQPTLSVESDPAAASVCLPDTKTVAIRTAGLAGFDGAVNLELTADLPAGVSGTFDRNTINAGEAAELTFDFSDTPFSGLLEAEVMAIAPDLADTVRRTIYFTVVSNDFSELRLEAPGNGQTLGSLTTDFAWTPNANAQGYDFQLATSPTFAEGTLVRTAEGLRAASLNLADLQLERNTVYYWRIRPFNDCGTSDWTLPSAFQTAQASCETLAATDTPINLPGTGPALTRTSEIVINQNGTIDDLNIPGIDLRYQVLPNVTLTLVSPAGTRVRLYAESCPNFTSQFNIGFDGEATDSIPCPPDEDLLFLPVDPMSALYGENAMGTWQLEVGISETGGSTGFLNNWSIEYCAAGAGSDLQLVNNDTLKVPPGMRNPVTLDLLLAEETNATPSDINFVLIDLPREGELTLDGQPLSLGATLSQAAINAGRVFYQHFGDGEGTDRWNFIVTTTNGGLIGRTEARILISEDAVVNVDDPVRDSAPAMVIFPNPTSDQLQVQFAQPLVRAEVLRLFALDGRLLRTELLAPGINQYDLAVGSLPAGMYLLRVGRLVSRVVVR